MKKIVKKLLLFLPLVLVVATVNYVIDPANIFKGPSYEKGIAALLLNGSNVGGLENYDERLTVKYYVEGLSNKKDMLVIGSSRSMQIDAESVGSNSFFNGSVSGASLEDYYAVYGLFKKKDLIPSKIILGIDPWVLNKNSGEMRWISLADSYYYTVNTKPNLLLIKKYNIENSLSKFEQLFSPSYFQNSVAILFNQVRTRKSDNRYYATSVKQNDDIIKHADGSLIYGYASEELNNTMVEGLSKGFTKGQQIYALEKFDNINPGYLNLFENFINDLKKDGIRVFFYLPPYSPAVYDYMLSSTKYKMVFEVQKYLENYAKENGIEIVGSYNPHDLGLKDINFQDGQHLKTDPVKSIFKRVSFY